MLITKDIIIDMGHRVPAHRSKCFNLHGHAYQIEVGVDDKVIQTKGTPNEGMVIDFGDLKQIMMDVIDKQLDHGFMMYEQDLFAPVFKTLKEQFKQKIIFVPFIPTAENISKYLYEQMKVELKRKNIKIHHVKVWETRTSTATYEGKQ